MFNSGGICDSEVVSTQGISFSGNLTLGDIISEGAHSLGGIFSLGGIPSLGGIFYSGVICVLRDG